MVGLEPEGPGGTLWERVRLCGTRWRLCVPGFVFAGPLGKGSVWWGRLCLGCPACEPPSHWVSLVPPPFSRPKQSRYLFSQTLAESGGHMA